MVQHVASEKCDDAGVFLALEEAITESETLRESASLVSVRDTPTSAEGALDSACNRTVAGKPWTDLARSQNVDRGCT